MAERAAIKEELRAYIDQATLKRTAAPGKSTARFWRFDESNFYIGTLHQDPLLIAPGEPVKVPWYPEPLPEQTLVAAFTIKQRRWKIYSTVNEDKAWLKSLGLYDAVFPSRQEALWHLKEALKARFS